MSGRTGSIGVSTTSSFGSYYWLSKRESKRNALCVLKEMLCSHPGAVAPAGDGFGEHCATT